VQFKANKMKFLTFLLLCFPVLLFSQKKQFEGIIKFSQTEKSEDKQFDLKAYHSFFGDSFTSYIKPGLYRQDYQNSTGIQFVIYNYQTNLYYYKLHHIDTLFFQDCSNPQGDYKIEKSDKELNILNHRCNSLMLISQAFKVQYFYAKDFYINPFFFKEHKYVGYDLFTAAAESVYLGMIVDFGNLKVFIQAESIVEQQLDDEIFKLPNLPLKEK
jgi:hypothetical protein